MGNEMLIFGVLIAILLLEVVAVVAILATRRSRQQRRADRMGERTYVMQRRLKWELHWLYSWLTVQHTFWLPQAIRWWTFRRAMRLRTELCRPPADHEVLWNNAAFVGHELLSTSARGTLSFDDLDAYLLAISEVSASERPEKADGTEPNAS